MAHPKIQAVRERFHFCCGYCGVSETDAGGEFTVDHYQPVSEGGDDSDANLVYACWRCNLHKSDFWPSPQEAANGLRLLHPLQDDISLHIRENERGVLEALTPTGRVRLTTLFLNRVQLVAHRLRNQEAHRQIEQYQATIEIMDRQTQSIRQVAVYLALLRHQAQDQNRNNAPDE